MRIFEFLFQLLSPHHNDMSHLGLNNDANVHRNGNNYCGGVLIVRVRVVYPHLQNWQMEILCKHRTSTDKSCVQFRKVVAKEEEFHNHSVD